MLILIIILNSAQLCLAQTEFNKFDVNGKKNGIWKGFYQDSKQLRFEGFFENGIEVGVFKFYDNTESNSNVSTRTFSKNGFVAANVFFDAKGNIISQGTTVNKLNDGVWTFFHEGSKEIRMTENYVKGKLNGTKKIFYKGNILAEESNFKDGLKTGIYKIYTEKGLVIEESNFKNGEYNGLAIFRAPSGTIISKGNFVMGAKKGKWQFFENGKLKKEVMMPEKIKFKIGKVKKIE
jgi:antitoxin component YwqK of YwqJK toxin-antitoxin module